MDHNDLQTLSVLANYRRWIVAQFAPYLGQNVIEFGAGIGSMSGELAAYSDTIHLVEPYESAFRRLQENFADQPNVRLSRATIESTIAATFNAMYDSAVLVNVLEHIGDDGAAISGLYRILKPNGSLCLFVPAHSFLFSDYDRLAGHHRRYELIDLKSLVMKSGFEVVRAAHFDALGVLPWLVTMRLMGQTQIRPGLAQFYDTVAVPLGRVLESVVSFPFGKNIVLVARKPASTL